MENQQEGDQPNTQTEEPNRNWSGRIIPYIKSKFEEHCAEKKKENPTDRAARRTANATCVIAFFTVVTVGVGYFQWSALRSTDEATHEAARAATRAAEISAVANRAWVAPITAKLVDPLDERTNVVTIEITAQNVGREPALGTQHGALIDAAPADQIKDRKACEGLLPQLGEPTMYPSDRFGDTYKFASAFKGRPTVIADIIAGRQILFIMGCFAYESAGKPRHSGFCFYLYPEIGPETGNVLRKPINEWTFKGCPVGNFAT